MKNKDKYGKVFSVRLEPTLADRYMNFLEENRLQNNFVLEGLITNLLDSETNPEEIFTMDLSCF